MTLRPQLAQEAELSTLDHFVTDDRYVGEQKVDGDRVMFTDGTPLNRYGNLYTKRVPQAVLDFRMPKGLVIDGELVGKDYWVFDLPVIPGQPADLPLTLRRAALEGLLGGIKHPFKLLPQAVTTEEKRALAKATVANNSEGLIFKRTASKYRMGGRTTDWLKVKYTTTADVVVRGLRENGKESMRLGVYDEHGVMIDIGDTSLLGKEKFRAVEIGQVAEVRYLYVGRQGRLYQPTLVRIRGDKRPEDCTTQQLKHCNKEVLEAL